MTHPLQLIQQENLFIAKFTAMASPCEILLETQDQSLALKLSQFAQQEALRIQQKFSRYETNNIIWQLNNAQGKACNIDSETALLLQFADQCYQLSDGLFDITSGSLGRAWKFDGSANIPSQEAIEKQLAFVGWQKVNWNKDQLQMPAGMQIDFGGIGKEYAVDRGMMLLRAQADIPLLVNFGGDLAVSGTRADGSPWKVGIEKPDSTKTDAQDALKKKVSGCTRAEYLLEISAGALATSGDAQRFLLANNRRFSHILNPFTGWPVTDAPRSITVAGSNCIQAGMLATFGLLQGVNAETFLEEQGVNFWCLR